MKNILFDKDNQILALSNEYVSGIIDEVWGDIPEAVESLKTLLGDDDVEIYLMNTVEVESFDFPLNVVTPEGFPMISLISEAGTYSLLASVGDGLYITTKDSDLYDADLVLKEDFITVTGSSDDEYDVVVNDGSVVTPYVVPMCEMTETEQKCYMINCLAAIKDAINEAGGNITDETPYSEYASAISGTTVIKPLTITPSTSEQNIDASNCDGYTPITVSAVTSAIDSNIKAENIKSGVTILGVEGTYIGE